MKTHSRYTITIENESRLERVFQASMSSAMIILIISGGFLALLALGALLLYVTPAHSLLPGYLKDSERAATEELHMRLDSLQQAYSVNEGYITNVMSIIDRGVPTVTHDKDSAPSSLPLSTDSIIPLSAEETRFMGMMNERERYNISVIAPLAAEGMMFTPVNPESVMTSDTRKSQKATVVLASRQPVAAIADGTVIAISQSLPEGGGSAVIIQHPKGFLSRSSRLGTVMVQPGEKVTGGQIIALTPGGGGIRHEIINLEMWHNGIPLIPYEYLGDSVRTVSRQPEIDVEVGRGRL